MVTGPVTKDETPPIKRNSWADYFFRPLLITIMIMCLNISLVNFARLLNPAWSGIYFLAGMLLTTVEGLYSFRILKMERSRGLSVVQYRLAEWTVLALLLRILSFVDQSVAGMWAELRYIWENPLEGLLTLEFFMVLTLAFIAWIIATNTMSDFEELHDPWLFRADNTLPLDNLAVRFFWGGIVLVFISGITYWVSRAGLDSLTDFQRPSAGGIILNVLIYFTLGLVMLSQARLTTLLVRWSVQKITVAPSLVRQWAKYGLIFLALIALVAFVLPTGYTLGFLNSAGIVVGYLLGGLLFLIRLFIFLLQLPLFLLFKLLGGTPPEAAPPPELVPPALPDAGQAFSVGPPWLEAIKSLVFWLVTVAIIWYLIKIYLNDHPEIGQALKGIKPVNLLIRFLRQVWQRLWGLAETGWQRVPKWTPAQKEKNAGAPSAGRWNWFGLRSSPRERILAYYLNVLKQAESHGPVRKKHQTPYEYQPELSQAMPDLIVEVDSLTEAFIQARYSRAAVDDAQANLVKRYWQEVGRALKKRHQKE